MKLLHFADLHLDTSFRWADPSYARHRRRALEETLKEICRLAVRHQVDALTCGGDLYEHDRFTPHTRDFLQSTFAELSPIRVFLAPGNHDWYGPQSLYSQADWSDNVRVFTTPTLTAVPLTDGITLWVSSAMRMGPV
jgi:DNA repair exonuclease SbcCD nuclease subunit